MTDSLQQRWAPTLGLRALPAPREEREEREEAAGKFQDPKGGLNSEGRKHFGVKKGVTNYSDASDEGKKRWVRWALRFTKTPKPLKDDAGNPTRYALMFRAWGEPVPTSASAVTAVHTKAMTRAKQLGMGEQAAELDHADDELFRSDNAFWEDVVNQASDTGPYTGVMVALYPSREQAQQLMVHGGEMPQELHCTLAFLGEVGAELTAQDRAPLDHAVTMWAATQAPFAARTNGMGVFHNDPPVTYASVDSPQLPALRQSLVEALEAAGMPPVQTYGFVPHMTLVYDDLRASEPDYTVPDVSMDVAHIVVAFAGKQTSIPLAGNKARSVAASAQALDVTPWTPTINVTGNSTFYYTNERPARPTAMETQPPAPAEPKQDEDVQRAFTTEINGKTLIAAPARTLASMRDPSLEEITAEPLLWMHGKFVGAEVANRNGALWSSGDLEMGQGSVAHGPLNWLHEARHIIGSIAKADYVKGQNALQAAAAGAAPAQPHITATAAIWKWIYPDEAFVVNQASDLGQLWYSMECISKEVGCAGPNGCGNTTTYAQYMNGAACEHVTQRASIRHFKDPVFLGGAVIVPPTRPGWAEADASVMKTAAGLAEAAYEQAGEPDMSTGNWEQLMAQLVLFANQ